MKQCLLIAYKFSFTTACAWFIVLLKETSVELWDPGFKMNGLDDILKPMDRLHINYQKAVLNYNPIFKDFQKM